jgi:catechol 2,3-dioxygenase-like lactoylglutathione lyase family enzyme
VLFNCFNHKGNEKDLEEAITFYREALHVRLVDHLNQFLSLSNLAKVLFIHFKHQGNFKDVHKALANAYSALFIFALNHPR